MSDTSGAAPNRIDAMFARKRERGERAMIFYVTAGYPDMATTEETILALDEAGADLIELGIPFSDPIADGPTIQKASQISLEAGTTVSGILEMAKGLRRKTEIPMVAFGAFNPILHYGLSEFVRAAKDRAGIDGLLIPDLPPEEAGELIELCRDQDLKLVFLAAPTSSLRRQKLIARSSTGFIYYISLRGVTGAREKLPDDLRSNLESLKSQTDLPVAVGFGISKPEHARIAGEVADGVVVGSALIDLIGRHAGTPRLKDEVMAFARGLIEALPTGEIQVST